MAAENHSGIALDAMPFPETRVQKALVALVDVIKAEKPPTRGRKSRLYQLLLNQLEFIASFVYHNKL